MLRGLILLPCMALASPAAGAAELAPGDVLVADAGAGVLRIDPTSGAQTVVAGPGAFGFPFGITVDARGHVLVSDYLATAVLDVEPGSGTVAPYAAGGDLLGPIGLVTGVGGRVFVADGDAFPAAGYTGGVFEADATGQVRVASSGGAFADAVDVAAEADGQLVVADFGAPAAVLRVDPDSGAQAPLPLATGFVQVMALAVEADGGLVVSDHLGDRIFRLDPATGAPTPLTAQGAVDGPRGLAVEADGGLLVVGGATGEILRVDAVSGAVSVLASGGSLSAPLDVAVVPWACADGLDNDGDTLVDGADPGCDGPDDVAERSPALPCDDGSDDDGDLRIDAEDEGCRDPTWISESPECSDGVNNDPGQDALVDWDGGGVGPPDPQCPNPWKNRERSGGCGLGAELAPAAAAWARLRRRRPRRSMDA